jgi:valyl-tRNA synthetase
MLESISKIKSYSYDTALINNFLEIYSQVRNLRIKQGIKNATIIDINIIGNRKINVNNLNAMLSKININLNSVVSKETSSSHELLVCKTFSIEILNDFGKNKFDIVELQTKLKSLGDELARSKAILSNKSFIAKAPKEKVDLEIKKQKEYQEQYDQVKEMIGRNK